MANSADQDQLASDLDLHLLQRWGISRFSRTSLKKMNSGKAQPMHRWSLSAGADPGLWQPLRLIRL